MGSSTSIGDLRTMILDNVTIALPLMYGKNPMYNEIKIMVILFREGGRHQYRTEVVCGPNNKPHIYSKLEETPLGAYEALFDLSADLIYHLDCKRSISMMSETEDYPTGVVAKWSRQ